LLVGRFVFRISRPSFFVVNIHKGRSCSAFVKLALRNVVWTVRAISLAAGESAWIDVLFKRFLDKILFVLPSAP